MASARPGLRRLNPARSAIASLPVEKELWQGSYSPKDMAGPFLLAALASIAAVVTAAVWGELGGAGWLWLILAIAAVWIALGLQLAYRRLSIRYRLTDQRFFHEHGILTRVVDRIEVIDMDDITFEQGLVDRFFGVGTIKVSSSDVTHPMLLITGIDDVQKVAGLIDNARRAERLRRGLHIESV